MAANIANLTADSFDAAIAGPGPVLVDFWAPWCGPCRAIAPMLEQLAKEVEGVTIAKVNVDENDVLAARYAIRAIPTLLLFNQGKLVETMVGLVSKESLKAKITAQLV